MTKSEFLFELQSRLSSLSDEEKSKTTLFYSEMIEDRIEDGMTEEEAIDGLGSIDKIVSEALGTEDAKPMNEGKKRSTLPTWLIVLLAVIWIPVSVCVICAAFALAVSIICAVVGIAVSIFSAMTALFGSAIAVAVASVMHFVYAELPVGFVYLGLSLAFIGGGLLLVKPMILGFKLIVITVKWIFGLLTKAFRKKQIKAGADR